MHSWVKSELRKEWMKGANNFKIVDDWTKPSEANRLMPISWTGRTSFYVEHETNDVNEKEALYRSR